MIPQGSVVINTDYFSKLTATIDACHVCSELQTLASEAMASIGAMKAGIESELAKLTPVLALLSPPSADPGKIVTWITSFITQTLTPMIKPTITYVQQLEEMAAQISNISISISAAAARIPSCSISVPSV